MKRTVLGDPAPYDPLDLPHTEMGRVDGVPNDPSVRPSLDEVLALRADRMATVRAYIDGLTDDALDRETDPNPAPGYPASGSYVVSDCRVRSWTRSGRIGCTQSAIWPYWRPAT